MNSFIRTGIYFQMHKFTQEYSSAIRLSLDYESINNNSIRS